MSGEVRKAVDEWFAGIANDGLTRRMTDKAWPQIAEYIRDLEHKNAVLSAANEAFKMALSKPKGGDE